MAFKLIVIIISLDFGFSYNARFGGELYQDGRNARNAAMGGLSISYADGSNPVLLRNKKTPSIHFSHKNKFGGKAQVTILSYIYTEKKYPIYFGLTNRSVNNIPNTSIACNPITLDCNYAGIDYFSQQEIGIQLSTIRYWGPYTLGFNIKPSFIGLAEFGKGYGISGDLAVLFQPFDKFDVTLRMEDILWSKYWDLGTVETIAPLIIGGIKYQFDRLTVGLERGSRTESNTIKHYHVGFEYEKHEKLFFRLGTSHNRIITAGIGLKLQLMNFDYAYLQDTEFKETHVLSVGIDLDYLKRVKGKITP